MTSYVCSVFSFTMLFIFASLRLLTHQLCLSHTCLLFPFEVFIYYEFEQGLLLLPLSFCGVPISCRTFSVSLPLKSRSNSFCSCVSLYERGKGKGLPLYFCTSSSYHPQILLNLQIDLNIQSLSAVLHNPYYFS